MEDMNGQERSPIHKIDRKWVRENRRNFSEFPGLPQIGVFGDEESWLELMQFYCDDLKWLLSLDHHKFWSHMIYSNKAHELLVSYLKGCPPHYVKHSILVREDMKNIYDDVEHLVFLVFLRLSTEKESEGCYIRNLGEVIYNNYLFTVPVILDICLVYGNSNHILVKKLINNVITLAPDFLDDFQEIFPHFVKVLNTVKEKFLPKYRSTLGDSTDLNSNTAQDLILYLCDSAATIQIFLELYPNVCLLFNKSELICDIVYFYSSALPEISRYCLRKNDSVNKNSLAFNLIENIRVDLLKIVKSIFDFVLSETNEFSKEEVINEFLELMLELLSGPTFLFDYNMMYSVEFEVGRVVRDYDKVDSVKVDNILEQIAKVVSSNISNLEESYITKESDTDSAVKLNSLITEVKDIFPHLEKSFIRQCLNYYNNNTEKVIAAILENIIPPDLNKSGRRNENLEEIHEFKGKHKYKYGSLNEMLDDREEISKIKDKYLQLSLAEDDTYDDEYDDTYDDDVGVPVKEGDDMTRRPFIVPRVLRAKEESEREEEDEFEIGEEKEEEDEEMFSRDNFVENPSIARERMERTRSDLNMRDLVGKGRGHGQSKQVLKSREFKEIHKSFVSNHNRKKLAGRKFSRGMIPF